ERPDDLGRRAAYRASLDRAVADHPGDVELLLLRGQAEEPAIQQSRARGPDGQKSSEEPGAVGPQAVIHDHGMNSGHGSVRFYESALAERADYFAAHHYLVHAYENGNDMPRALEHARKYAQLASAIPHAHHMYGHVLRRVDRMNDAIAQFQRADDL